MVARRAEHVVTENDRVRATVNALATSDVGTLRKTMAASHESLRWLYEVSSPELDALVEIAGRVPGVIGARMTGGGFGGCTINLVRPDAAEDLVDAVAKEYVGRTGLTATVFSVQASPGVRRLV
jgi:galactokinase